MPTISPKLVHIMVEPHSHSRSHIYHWKIPHRLTLPSVLILYQDIIVSLHGVNVLIGFADRRLYCTSEDLIESFDSTASPYCAISGKKKSHNCTVRPVSIMPDPKWGPIILLLSNIILAIHFCRSHIRPSGPSTGNMDHHPSWLHTSRFLQSILLQENNYWQEEGTHSAYRVTVNWSLFYPHSILHSFRSRRLQSYWYSISSNCLHCQE